MYRSQFSPNFSNTLGTRTCDFYVTNYGKYLVVWLLVWLIPPSLASAPPPQTYCLLSAIAQSETIVMLSAISDFCFCDTIKISEKCQYIQAIAISSIDLLCLVIANGHPVDFYFCHTTEIKRKVSVYPDYRFLPNNVQWYFT